MSDSNKTSITSLDFDGIKLSLQQYLSSQSLFTDYDFAGSGLSVILNLLSYNTVYLAFYLNMIVNEMFLDSADRRENIVARAKELGYIPYSRKSSQAAISLKIIPPSTPPPPAYLTINPYTRFTSSINGNTYTFVNLETVTIPYDIVNGWYLANNITLNEGVPYTFRYTVDLTGTQQYIIPNSSVDTNTLIVTVQESSQNSALTVFTLGENINNLNGESSVYFLQEISGSRYQVYFGDGILGAAVANGNIISLTYLNCNGSDPNFCNLFTPASPIGGFNNITVTTLNAAFGGSERETLDSVRFSAPMNYKSQDRAVTSDDFSFIISNNYPNVSSVAVWGGQDEDPPQYGKVFVSLKPVSGYQITQLTKQSIIDNVIQPKSIVSIIPTIIDPDYTYLNINSLVKYNAQGTISSASALQALVITTISNFGTTQIDAFESIFRYSQLTKMIDATDPSITNNLTNIQVQKRFAPKLNSNQSFSFNFYNSILPNTISSAPFIVNGDPNYVSGNTYFFDDDGLGNLRIYKFAGTTKTYINFTNPIGTINYINGTIILSNFNPKSIIDPSGTLRFFATPAQNDVTPVRNNILIIDPLDIIVNMQANLPLLV